MVINNFISIAQVTVNVFNYDTIPGKGLLQFLEKKKYTDVNFVVDGHQVPAHRCVVAAQSDYFDCLLFGSMKEAHSDEIVLEDTPLEAFRVLLHYMYSGSVKTLDMQVRGCHDCLLYTTQIIGVETIWDLHTLTKWTQASMWTFACTHILPSYCDYITITTTEEVDQEKLLSSTNTLPVAV